MLPWCSYSGGSGSRGSLSGSFGKSADHQCSIALTWRKDGSVSAEEKGGATYAGKENEVISPLKVYDNLTKATDAGDKEAKKNLFASMLAWST